MGIKFASGVGGACGRHGSGIWGLAAGRTRSRWGRAAHKRRFDKQLRLEPLEARQLLAAQPVITEFMASNQGTLDDGDGNSSDWIEIHNAGDEPVDLAGYRLTDDAEELSRWTFPSVTVEPGGYLVVFASGQETNDYVDAGGNLHTNFRLSSSGEYLALVAPDGTVLSQFGSPSENFPPQLGDVSYGIAQTVVVHDTDDDASYQVALSDLGPDWTTPGYDAAANGFIAGKSAIGFEDRPTNNINFADDINTEVPSGTHGIYARFPFQVSNAAAIDTITLRMKYDNGFVGFLNGQKVLQVNAPDNVSWYSLALEGNRRDADALEFEDFSLTEFRDRLVDGENVFAIHGLNHNSDNSDMLFAPQIVLGTLDMESAFGVPAAVGYMTNPTPGRPNGVNESVHAGLVADSEVSVEGGFHDTPFQVEVTNETPGATIYYTLDSSLPSETNGTVYSGPITIDHTTVLRTIAVFPEFLPGSVTTDTYVFLDDVLTQNGAGLPRYWGVLGGGCNNTNTQAPAPANYDMDRRVVNDPRYRDTIRDDLKSVPMMSLVLDPADLWGEERGIYSNPLMEGKAWERPVSMQLFNLDGESEFQIDAGLRIHGGWGRCPSQSNKHSLRVLFRNEYGSAKLNYPMFGEDATDSFDTFVLRANFNHSWATGDGNATTFINDQFAAETQLEMGYVGPHSKWVHLYINGLYWGLYNPMERPSAPFAADYFGGDKDDYDVLVVGTATDGDTRAWNELVRAANQGDYDTVQEMLDVDAAIDYFIINQYGGNWDWPQNNWYASRNREVEGSKWHFHSWDAEGMFGNGLAENRVNQTGGALGGLYASLRRIEDFRVRFADRIQKNFFNDGLLTPEANTDRLNRLAAPIDRAVVGESARWGDGRTNSGRPATRDDNWLPRLEFLRNEYFPERGDRVLDQYRAVDLWPDTQAPQLNRHGGPVQKGFALTIRNPQATGTVYYSLDGTDPRLPGGDVAPGAIVYDGATITINDDLTVLARVLNDDGEWSPLTEADFLVTGLRITEVNYHPHDPNPVPGMGEMDVDSSQFEFIELTNVGTDSVDLTGAHLTGGIKFEFPDGATLLPGERTLVVHNNEAFESRYGTGRNVAGEFTDDLSDIGDLIELRDGSGERILGFRYSVSGAWPSRANGRGSSLEMVDPFGSYTDVSNWRGSSEYGGSPGAEGLGRRFDVVINEVVGHGVSAEVDQLELHNTTGAAIDINHWYFGNPDTDPFRYQVSASTTIGPDGYLAVSENELGAEFNIGEGDRVWLVEADANGVPLRVVDEAEFGPAAAGTSIGPWPNQDSAWLPLASPTIGRANAGRKVGDVVITEVNFDPVDLDGDRGQRIDNFEFVELYNTTSQPIDLTGWRLSGDMEFDFPDDTTIEPNVAVTVVPFSTTSSTAGIFRFVYNMGQTAPMVGRYRTKLPNDEGATIRLEGPSVAPGQESDSHFVYVDEISYGVQSPWPTGANMTGSSFNRLSPDAYGNSPSSWIVVTATPGSVDFTLAPRIPGDANEDGVFNQRDIVAVLQAGKYLTGQPATWSEGDFSGDGLFNQLDIVAALQGGRYLAGAQQALTTSRGRSVDSPVSQQGLEELDTRWAARDLLFAHLGQRREVGGRRG